MSNSSILPSYFATPFITDIPHSKYDSKGRQLSFVETEVQRLERMALVHASKSRSSSPSLNAPKSRPSLPKTQDRQPSGMGLIVDEYMANYLAEEYSFNDDFSSLKLSDELQPQLEIVDSTGTFLIPTSCKSSSSPSNFQPGHRRKRRSLSSIRDDMEKYHAAPIAPITVYVDD